MMTEWCHEDFRRRHATKELFEAYEQEVGRKTSTLSRLAIAIGVVLVLLAGSLAAALAQPTKPPLSVAQALSILQAMRGLDGHVVTVKQNGVDTQVVQPWDFGSGSFRLRIAKNIAALGQVEQDLETTRQGIVRELLKSVPDVDGKRPTNIPDGSPQYDELQRQYREALNAGAAVTLFRVKASELKLDRNEIPITVLSAMEPILDDDVSPQ
jgi:hypothetical protein